MEEIFLTQGQFAVFWASVLFGVIAGGAYSLSRAFCAVLGGGRVAVAVTDTVFGIAAVAIAAVAGLKYADGAVRLYWIAGVIAGCAAYLCSVHKVLAKIASIVYTKLKPKWDACAVSWRARKERVCEIFDSMRSERRRKRRLSKSRRQEKKRKKKDSTDGR